MGTALKHLKLFADKVNMAILREKGVLSVSKITKAPLPDFVASLRGLLQKESELSSVRRSDGFNLNVYMMMKSSYNFSKPPPLGNVIEARPYEPNDTQKMIQR